MKLSTPGKRIAVIGASSLLGKELLALVEESALPVSRLVTLEEDEGEPELPIVDLREGVHEIIGEERLQAEDFDLAFVTATPQRMPAFVRALGDGSMTRREWEGTVIDLTGALASPQQVLARIPFLERSGLASAVSRGKSSSRVVVSPHPATIALVALLLRLAARFPIQRVVAQVFVPASEIGSRAIEELQNQAVSLLSFREVPQSVYGGQLAFNLLPRLSGARGTRAQNLEARVRREVQDYLGSRVPPPALRVFQAPIFYSLAISVFVETASVAAPEAVAAALAGKPVCTRRPTGRPPSPVEAAGTDDILVDAVTPDPGHSTGLWIWAATDNLRLAATNALAIAESLG